jgi:hypothetical protein
MTFFLQFQIEFFFSPPWRYYIFLPSSKILEVHSCFWRCESLPERPKNPSMDIGPLGVKLIVFCQILAVFYMFGQLWAILGRFSCIDNDWEHAQTPIEIFKTS